jgi:hypothetical protein
MPTFLYIRYLMCNVLLIEPHYNSLMRCK